MKIETFINAINYLNNWYKNFNFEYTNEAQINIWFNVFKDVEDKLFIKSVKKYCEDNNYPPQSPKDLIDKLIEIKKNEFISSDEAFQIIYENIYRNKEIDSSDLALLKTKENFEERFNTLLVSDKPYLERDVKKYYNELLNKTIKDSLKINLIKNNDKLSIE